ncbi:uncharacterized protein DS421_20g694630 [Arachis hypogaea]|nr:uncharacterized protein DS421_20g694630 [Arachis hypogaea]
MQRRSALVTTLVTRLMAQRGSALFQERGGDPDRSFKQKQKQKNNNSARVTGEEDEEQRQPARSSDNRRSSKEEKQKWRAARDVRPRGSAGVDVEEQRRGPNDEEQQRDPTTERRRAVVATRSSGSGFPFPSLSHLPFPLFFPENPPT